MKLLSKVVFRTFCSLLFLTVTLSHAAFVWSSSFMQRTFREWIFPKIWFCELAFNQQYRISQNIARLSFANVNSVKYFLKSFKFLNSEADKMEAHAKLQSLCNFYCCCPACGNWGASKPHKFCERTQWDLTDSLKNMMQIVMNLYLSFRVQSPFWNCSKIFMPTWIS